MKRVLAVLLILLFIMTDLAQAATVSPYSQGFVEGYLRQINIPPAAAPATTTKTRTRTTATPAPVSTPVTSLDIEDYNGQSFNFPVAADAVFSIDGIPVKLSDFKAGMEVYATLRGKSIISLEGYSTAQLGYINPGSKVITGVIRKLDRDQLQLQQVTGELVTCVTSPATLVSRNGINASLDSLYVGDRVKCYFDTADASVISRINIEGDSIIIKDVYRGTLQTVNAMDSSIVLSGFQVLRNGQWTASASSHKVYYNNQVPAYMGGQLIPYQNLKYYLGKTVYMATRDFFGREQIEKMVFKNQYEADYQEQIKDVNWYTDALELSNNKNLTFNEGTIIVKNGRLVDKYALDLQNDAMVVADGRGSTGIADVISIYNEDINNSNIGQRCVYAGRLDQIVQDKIWLKDFFVLNENTWESFNDTKELFYDNDTSIYDLESGQAVTPQEFYSKDYAVDEHSERVKTNKLKDWYGYIYTDGDRIAAIAVQKNMDSLLQQRVSNGTVASTENNALVGWTISIRESKDWSSVNDCWMARTTDLRVNLGKALIIKEGRIILPKELTAGDRIYVVRDDITAKVVIVK
ncbi:MAG: hypothetical protein ABFC94_05215 [Syntrophomonas sp.]